MKLLPDAVFDQHIIVLGKTRSGKSSAMRFLVEHLLDQKKPVTVIDPKGDWYGLKLSANGKGPGYPVVIFGGEHADVPLNARSGSPVAELLATGNRSAIVDLGGWMPGDRTQFWIDFASTYFRAHRGRRYLVIDEAHNFCFKGKVFSPEAGKMLHWSNRLASEGLGRGIFLIGASQRPQKVHNDFLTSCETLMAMRVIHAADRTALKEWIDGCGDPARGKELLESVAMMKRGEAWGWSPEAGFGPERIQFPMFKTYDSFKASTVQSVKLTGWAEVDLNEVKRKLESAVKEAEANDPSRLRHRIAELQSELQKRAKQAASLTVPLGRPEAVQAIRRAQDDVRGEYREFTAKLERRLKDLVNALRATAAFLSSQGESMRDRSVPLLELVASKGQMPSVPAAKTNPTPARIRLESARAHVVTSPLEGRAANPAPASDDGLTGPERRILKALGELLSIGKDRPTKAMVAAWARYSPKGGAFINPLGSLRSKGYVAYPQPGAVALTEIGKECSGQCDPPDQNEVQRRVRSICTGPERRILSVLLEVGPAEMPRAELAERAGYAEKGGAFVNPLGALRTKGLLDYPRPGIVQASEWLFTE